MEDQVIETGSEAAKTPVRKLSWLGDAAATALLATVVSVAVGFIIEKRVEDQVEAALLQRPDIAVVDDLGLVRLAISNGADRYDPAQVSSEIERMVEGAGLGDTILLSRSMVIYTPPEASIDVAAPKLDAAAPRREIGP